jgi:O-antigen/teichoic acid export membrane protein
VLYWLLVPAMGMTGGAIAFLIVSMVWSAWLNVLVRRYVRIRPSLIGRRPL